MARAKPDEPKVEELPPCGRCTVIGRNRLEITTLTPPDGREIQIIRRCPECSPHKPGCGEHVTPPGRPCELCMHHVGPRVDRPYAGTPPRPPGPAEPGDLARMSVRDIAQELKDLREAGPLPARIGPRPAWEEVELRQLATRQCAASRAAGTGGPFREPEFRPRGGKHAR